MNPPHTIPLANYREYPADEMRRRAESFYHHLDRRRSVRDFSDRPVPRDVIENCLRAAGTAPSGANLQPWHFVVVEDAATRRSIREAAEREEREFYSRRASEEWLADLEPFGTNADKPFLDRAPCLIAVFEQRYSTTAEGTRRKHYYSPESVGLATGLLIAAIHDAGLASLTHTPSPMGFLREILGRPENARPFLLLVVGYPEVDARVPDIARKRLDEYTTFVGG